MQHQKLFIKAENHSGKKKKEWVITGDSENPYLKYRDTQEPICVSAAQDAKQALQIFQHSLINQAIWKTVFLITFLIESSWQK